MLRKVLRGCSFDHAILNLEHLALLISTMPSSFRATALAKKPDFAQENHEFCGHIMVHLLNNRLNRRGPLALEIGSMVVVC